MVVHPSVEAKTVPEFIAYVKANPGKVTMASAGDLAGELFNVMAGIEMTRVPYRGAPPAITDLLGGQVQVFFSGIPPALDHIRAGRLRALAVTSATRLGLLPGTPTVSDFLPGYEAGQWYAVGLRKNTPFEITEKLNKEINAVLTDPSMAARLADLGTTAFLGSPAALGNFVAEESDKWRKVVRAANIKPE
jgi:tripartite-type tricarboxylate transporter receptor subunit TctC